jgi:hypothetical protein
MQKNHAYVFKNEEDARKFYNSIDEGGWDAELVGNVVMSDDRVFDWVANYYNIDTADYPVWMSESY